MKKYLIVLASLFMFLTFSGEVKAVDIESGLGNNVVNDSCIDKNTCMALCNYTRTETKKIDYSGREKDYKLKTTLFYSFSDKKYFMKYQNLREDSSNSNYSRISWITQNYTIDTNTFSKYLKPNYLRGAKIEWLSDDSSPSTSNFACPKNLYYQPSTLSFDWCFDNDKQYCKTKFESLKRKPSEAQSNDYNYEKQVNTYVNEIIKKYETEIKKGELDPKTDLPEIAKRDFIENFMHGNDIPEFIANSEEYNKLFDGSFAEAAKKSCDELLKDADAKLQNGSMTQEEYDNLKSSCTITEEDLSKMKEDMEEVKEYFDTYTDFKESPLPESWGDFSGADCDSILGSTAKKDKPDPAYYMNFIFNLMKYIAIVLLFILTIVDFAKAIPSNDNEAIKKTVSKTIKRIILCIIIYFLPTFLNFVLETFGIVDDPTCGIGV